VRRIASGAVAVLLAINLTAASRAATTYDGTWQLIGAAQSVRCPSYTMQIVVTGNHLSATVGLAKLTTRIAGTVSPDGSFVAQNSASVRASGRFSGDTVTAELTDNVCTARSGTGQKTK
jgi:hypothetical protein